MHGAASQHEPAGSGDPAPAQDAWSGTFGDAMATAVRVRGLCAAAERLRQAGAGHIVQHLASMAALRETMPGAGPGPDLWPSNEHMLLQAGMFFRLRAGRAGLRGEPNACFGNASMQVARQPRRWIYCEGFAASDQMQMPVHHAWLLDARTLDAVEVTWPQDWSGLVAVGVPVCVRMMVDALQASGTVLQDYARGYPILTGAIGVEAWWHAGVPRP